MQGNPSYVWRYVADTRRYWPLLLRYVYTHDATYRAIAKCINSHARWPWIVQRTVKIIILHAVISQCWKCARTSYVPSWYFDYRLESDATRWYVTQYIGQYFHCCSWSRATYRQMKADVPCTMTTWLCTEWVIKQIFHAFNGKQYTTISYLCGQQ